MIIHDPLVFPCNLIGELNWESVDESHRNSLQKPKGVKGRLQVRHNVRPNPGPIGFPDPYLIQ